MAETVFAELGASKVLLTELKLEEILRIMSELRIPDGLYQDIKQGSNFLIALKKWTGHNAFLFYQSLKHIRSDLVEVACKIKWLCVTSPEEAGFQQEEELTVKTLIELLKSEISKANWELIYMVITNEAEENANFEITLNKLSEKGLIGKDLKALTRLMVEIQRLDLVSKLQQYQNAFCAMEEEEFEGKFKKEIGKQAIEMKKWDANLKDFLQIQHSTVQQMLGDVVSVNLAEVFIDLTILKEKPRPINFQDETTYNEIAYLRKIANKEVEIQPVDFTQELTTYESKNPEIWCIIGNPGSGKTFLAKRTALRFSSNELTGIQYSISIPCRNEEWHSMEVARIQENKKVDSVFIQKWLCLGLPVGPSWTNDLAKHLNESSGDGVLFIIDGLDEFTRKVPFEKTLLCLLLSRQAMIKATIILTSRPGAWTDISSAHELKVNRYYQVLGFSPANRDLYFEKQIRNEKKLEECKSLLKRHDEMDQLSLIPVNASLFAALLRGEDSTLINTLTNLYYELTLYLIRRELARTGLPEFTRVERISDLHADILECLSKVGFIAMLGVANRELTSEENVPLTIGQEVYPSQCLGLAHEHYRTNSVGLVTKVWTFVHLTMQEFVSAHWVSNTSWTKQCFSIRYISHSVDNFSLFKMVTRFLCGLVTEKAAVLLVIMYRHLTPQPIPMIGMPITYQLKYGDIYGMSVWEEFTKIFFELIAIVYETNSNSLASWFNNFKQYFPTHIYLYVQQAVSPNEWFCFCQSLELVSRIQLIFIDTSRIKPTQFKCLIEKMGICSINLLALRFYKKDPTTVLSYTETIRETGIKSDTKISIELDSCDFSAETDVNIFPTSTNQIIDSLSLITNQYSHKALLELTYLFSAIQYLNVDESTGTIYDTMVPALCQATQLTVLHLDDIPFKHIPRLTAVLPKFSKLQEFRFHNASLLPAIIRLSNLTYLQIQDFITKDTTLCDYLLQIIKGNRNTLRGMELYCLHRIGLNNWSLLLNCLELCTNLIQLKLWSITLPSNDVTHWSSAVKQMKSLVELEFYYVSLSDTGLLSLCEGLIYHPAIRCLDLDNCNLTSLSCEPLANLIPTVSQLETLRVEGLSEPDRDPISLLNETADEFGIELKLD